MSLFTSIGIFWMASLAGGQSVDLDNVMDRIETTLALPADADPISSYARYYAFDDPGRIVAVYIQFYEPDSDHYSLPIGKRRWLDSSGELPLILDGGCGVVTVVYDLTTNFIENVFCNSRG